MILEHTTHAGYIRQEDVYTDENGVNYTVSQDTDAEDPRSWLTHEEAVLIVINADRNTRTDNIDDYDDNPVIDDLLQAMERDNIDDQSYGSARNIVDTFVAWARGDVWVVSTDHPDYDTLYGIYADDPESAVKHYIENYIPHELPQSETLF